MPPNQRSRRWGLGGARLVVWAAGGVALDGWTVRGEGIFFFLALLRLRFLPQELSVNRSQRAPLPCPELPAHVSECVATGLLCVPNRK